MQLLSDNELRTVRRGRRGLEVDVAKRVGRYLIERKKVDIKHHVITMLVAILNSTRTHTEKLDGFLWQQPSFAMWKNCHTVPSYQGLIRVLKHIDNEQFGNDYTWLNVCSDVIRLFGEFAETSWARNLNIRDWDIMARKGDLRPGPVYAKPEKSQDGWGHRHRLNREAGEINRIGAPFRDIPRSRVALRGVERFKFGGDSVIATLDWAYGLQIEGGDVSGTTTDSIAALRWASQNHADPIVHLIAIATMVPQGHHTIVECAWPLTRHGYINYNIGFYDTLVPGGNYNSLRNTLKSSFDNDIRNKHVLVCKARARIVKELALYFDKRPEEIELYKRLAGIRSAYGFCVGGKPSLDSLTNYARAHGASLQIIDRMLSAYHKAP